MNPIKKFPLATICFGIAMFHTMTVNIAMLLVGVLFYGDSVSFNPGEVIGKSILGIVTYLPLVIMLCMKKRGIGLIIALAVVPMSYFINIIWTISTYFTMGYPGGEVLRMVFTQSGYAVSAAAGYIIMMILILLVRKVQPGEKHYTRFLWFIPGLIYVGAMVSEYGVSMLQLLQNAVGMPIEEWLWTYGLTMVNVGVGAVFEFVISIGIFLLGLWVVNPWKKQPAVTEEV